MPLPLLLMAASSALQGVSKLASGYQTASANKAAALGAKIERDMAMIRRKQGMAETRTQLATMLGNLDAVRSARGASLDSATGQAIQRHTREDAYRAEAIAALAELQRAGAAEQQRRGFATAARWAVPMAAVSAASSFASAASYGSNAFASPSVPADLQGLY